MRNFISLLLLFGLITPALAAERLGDSNIYLDSDEQSDTWQRDEIAQASRIIQGLPVQLLQFEKPVHLFKSHTEYSVHQSQAQRINLDLDRPLEAALIHALTHLFVEQQHLAEDENWRRISGWGGRFTPLLLSAENQDVRAYAAESGMDSAEEDFVTAAELYFLPQDGLVEQTLKCRLPQKYHYLQQRFTPYVSAYEKVAIHCKPVDRGFLDDLVFFHPVTGEKIDIGPVNSHTVSGFELLYATPGSSDAAEIAGHLLLRVKLDNNPDAQQYGYENPNDLVISFLADTTEFQTEAEAISSQTNADAKAPPAICETGLFNTPGQEAVGFKQMLSSVWQALKGLSGGFLTIMDRQTLGQTVKHYTLDEDRNLLRFKLNLSDAQKNELLDYLYVAKKNYKSEYYFFSNNCASVLAKIVARGIGANDIAKFNPLVSPPNALIALYLRENLATPVYPSFNSFRRQGQLAQDSAKAYAAELRQRYPMRHWPDLSAVLNDDDELRSAAIKQFRRFSKNNVDLAREMWRLSQLLHQADLTYSFRDQVCQQITPQSTAEIRGWQRELQTGIKAGSPGLQYASYQPDMFSGSEQRRFDQGVPHTKLLNLRLAGGGSNGDGGSAGLFQIGAAFMQQDMGSMSNIAMQRSSAVDLGSLEVGFSQNAEQWDWDYWRFSALHVRKFRQRIDRVPNFFSNDGKLGLGLTLLTLHADRQADLLHGTLLGAESLFNLYSTENNDDHVFVSLGLDLHRHIEKGEDRLGLMLPVYLESLHSFRQRRQIQWRNHLQLDYAKPGQLEQEWELESRLSYRYSKRNPMTLFYVSAQHWRWGPDQAKTLFSVGVEIDAF